MAKRKAKKRFVLGEGYLYKSSTGIMYIYKSKNPEIITKSTLNWSKVKRNTKYRLVLEEV
jgi:hypothetical protein